MDFSELTNIILTRIQKLEPDNAIKILGCLFLSSPSEQRMLQLAFGSDDEIISIISDAKITLSILFAKQAVSVQPVPDRPQQFNSFSPAVSCPSLCVHAPYWEPQLASEQQAHIHNRNFVPNPFVNPIGDECTIPNQARFLSLHERPDTVNPMGPNFSSSGYYHDDASGRGLNLRASGRSSSLPEFPTKVCHYFFKGNCKHGENCKYLHGPCISDGDSHIYNLNLDDLEIEEHEFSPGSLDKLEMEIIELLKAREGVPVSIASLPMLYNEKYGKNLQAEGYLTESQRHGKSGFSLTKLLVRLKSSIRLIDRPHGQHSVILAEDVPRYLDFVNQRSESGALASSSHQIYLTFPAESTFTTDDVSNYFKQYGPVRDVRIPCQDKRMFGFVSFLYLETVKAILTKRNPHYICGARVLVKPYKEKSRTSDRTYTENFQPLVHFPPHYVTMDPDFQAVQRQFSSSRLIKKQQIEEHERLLELERRHFSEFNLEMKPLTEPYFSYSMEDYKIPEGPNKYPISDHFSYTLDNLNNGSMNDVKVKSTGNGHDNEESQIELPESPFASPHIESSDSAII